MDRTLLTKAQRWELSDCLARDRLPSVNSACAPVHPSRTLYARFWKRGIDIVVSAVALIITLPINLVAAVMTLKDVGRPIFFKQNRVGKDGRLFELIKFRNMTNERDGRGELLPPSQRVTRFGRFMRKTSLDELLNFWSVFKGDMSLIGPRPLVPEYTDRYSKRHKMRLTVRPGLECPPRELTDHAWTWQEQFENDVWYVEHVSFRTDCRMMLNLARFALDRKNSSVRASAERDVFVGYDADGNAIGLDQLDQPYIDAFMEGFSKGGSRKSDGCVG